MARRIVLGDVGSNYVFRVSRAGYDAATADLDGLLFDADHIPARWENEGTVTCPGGRGPVSGEVDLWYPGTVTVSHGSTPSVIMGLAYPLSSNNRWYTVHATVDHVSGTGNTHYHTYEFSHMDDNYCSPHWLTSDYDNGDSLQQLRGGWKLEWNSSTITITNNSPYPIRVRWLAIKI
ncbi:MAG TPA: hypothetical protein VEZ24_09195 [Microvirga sp.]|nr:hypothetical protein [Microvirga sp.]